MRLLEGDENLVQFSSLPQALHSSLLWQKDQPKMISKMLGHVSAPLCWGPRVLCKRQVYVGETRQEWTRFQRLVFCDFGGALRLTAFGSQRYCI